MKVKKLLKTLKPSFSEKILKQQIYKQKIYLGSPILSYDMENYVVGKDLNQNVYVFDVYSQMRHALCALKVLRFVKIQKKPILFFGLKRSGLNQLDKDQVFQINKLIFDLCFTIHNTKNRKEIEEKLDDFYLRVYSLEKNIFSDEVDIARFFFDFNEFLLKKISKEEISINGYFLDHWENGFFSNFHSFKSSLNHSVKKSFFTKNINSQNEFLIKFLESFSNFFFLSKSLTSKRFDNNEEDVLLEENEKKLLKNKKDDSFEDVDIDNQIINKPGVVVFFSRVGYDSFFKEFKKLGIPVICLLNTDDSFNDVDYPIFGNKTSAIVVLFYQLLMKHSLNDLILNKQFENLKQKIVDQRKAAALQKKLRVNKIKNFIKPYLKKRSYLERIKFFLEK